MTHTATLFMFQTNPMSKHDSANKILSISVGQIKPLIKLPVKMTALSQSIDDDNKLLSAIDKRSVSNLENDVEIDVNTSGIFGDKQSDLSIHGGLQKAVCVYPYEHYSVWENILEKNNTFNFGAFGENLTIQGLTEQHVFVGDQWTIGSAIFEVTEFREPCLKLNIKLNCKQASRFMLTHQISGWYLKVLKEGLIKAGDTINVLPGQRLISIADQNSKLLNTGRINWIEQSHTLLTEKTNYGIS
jgi:MOSC domain-containing protein YiiM